MQHPYETVIGLEIHVQLNTRSKVFCADDASFGGAPNTQVSAVSLAHPGTLPRLNEAALGHAIRLGLALGCEVNRRSTFDRKNYFYADLPKGFQTTQDQSPICIGGGLRITPSAPDKSQPSVIRIHHIHLEEDAGKSLHDQDPDDSLIDLNRAGVPLLEIVTEPDLRSAEEVAAFMTEIRRLVRWIGISDGNMEEGSLRCDVNVSVRKQGATSLGNRCEIKNMNSMRFARRAIAYEVDRQIGILEGGGRIEQETRGFDPASGVTYSLREKEDAHDYRYFPEPDLPPVLVTETWLETIRAAMPALPQDMEAAFRSDYGLPAHDAEMLTQEQGTTAYFIRLLKAGDAASMARPAANLIINKLLPWSTETEIPLDACPVSPEQWMEMLTLIETGKISASTAYQRLFPALLDNPASSPAQLAADMNLLQNTDTAYLETVVSAVLTRYPEKVAEYRKGKKGLIGFFMGEVMKDSKGKADPKAATQLLERLLA